MVMWWRFIKLMFASARVGTPINGFESSNLSKNKRPPKREVFRFVAKLGFEPRQTEPESVVLPLHHLAIPKGN